MSVYEETQIKERAALDAKFTAQANLIVERLILEIKKLGAKASKTAAEGPGSRTIIWVTDSGIRIEIAQDWGTARFRSGNLPTGKPKISLNLGHHGRGSTVVYRPNKAGEIHLEKIVKNIRERVEGYNLALAASKSAETLQHENDAVAAAELGGAPTPAGAVVNRDPFLGTYSFRFGGTFSGLSPQDVVALSDSFKKLAEQYKFEKSWRTDF